MDTWTKDKNGEPFGTNVVCFDHFAREMVMVSNGVCTLDHSSQAGFKATHTTGGCIYTPCEAVALRVVGAAPRKGRKAVAQVAYTYRSVRREDLVVLPGARWIDPANLSGYVGRV